MTGAQARILAAIGLASLLQLSPLQPIVHASEITPDNLPLFAFGPETSGVFVLRLEGVTTNRAMQTIQAIFPAEFQTQMAELTQELQVFETQYRQPLIDAGITSILGIVAYSDPTDPSSTTVHGLVPLDFDREEMQIETLQTLGSTAGGTIRKLGNWLLLESDVTGFLPDSMLDRPVIDDAPFIEALADLPEHDLAVVFVPNLQSRAMMDAGLEQSTADAEEGQAEIVNSVRGLTEAEWFALTVRLGSSPNIRLALDMSKNSSAAELQSGLQDVRKVMKEETRKDATSDPDPREHYDPRRLIEMVDALATETQGELVVMNLDRGEMNDVVIGALCLAELMVGAIADAVVDSVIAGLAVEDDDAEVEDDGDNPLSMCD